VSVSNHRMKTSIEFVLTDRNAGALRKPPKLLAADESIVSCLRSEGEVIFVSNSHTTDVVLCTPMETFQVTKVESSNTTLLAIGGLFRAAPMMADSDLNFHWDTQRINGRVDIARSLPSYDTKTLNAPGFLQLQASTQASLAEIESAIETGTILVDNEGGQFYVDEAKLYQCLDQVLTTISLNGWSVSAIPLKACVEDAATHGLNTSIAKHCLEHFALSPPSNGRISLDIRHIACALAKFIFITKGAPRSVHDLIADLRDSLPAQTEPIISWLDGIVSVSSDGSVSLV